MTSGVRVTHIPGKCTEKDIKIHFTKPENGGGPIQTIYFPLFERDAVVIFEESVTADTVMAHKHTILGECVGVNRLPMLQVFTTMEAQLDPAVGAFIQATDDVREEIQYCRNVEFCHGAAGNITGVRGNWYLLEWFWAHIEQIIKQQTLFQTYVTYSHPVLTSPSPKELDRPTISLPSAADSMTSLKTKSNSHDMTSHMREIVKTEVQHTVPEFKTQTGSDKKDKMEKHDKPAAHMKGMLADDDYERFAGLTISEEKDSTEIELVIQNDKPDDVRNLDFRYGPLTVSIYTGWITMAETDAIVNAAMGNMINGGGVAQAIADAADPEMQRQCDEYVETHGSLPTSDVMHTCAGGSISLNVKYVIHTVGPMWSDIRAQECAYQLTKSFLNCMVYGNDVLKIQSISMPLISSGIFGCPLEICVQSFLNAVLLFSRRHVSNCHLREVNLVNNDSDSTAISVLHLRQLMSLGTRVLVQDAQYQIDQKNLQVAHYPTSRAPLEKQTGHKLQLDTATTCKDPRQSRTSPSTSMIPSNRQMSLTGTAGLESTQTSRNSRSTVSSHSSSSSFDSVRAPTDTSMRLETATTCRDPRQRRTSPSKCMIPSNRQMSLMGTAGLESTQTSRNSRTTVLSHFSSSSFDSVRAPTDTSMRLETRTSGEPRGATTNSSKGIVHTPGPPTTSYLYSESQRPSARRIGGMPSGPVTSGRPLPPVPVGARASLMKK